MPRHKAREIGNPRYKKSLIQVFQHIKQLEASLQKQPTKKLSKSKQTLGVQRKDQPSHRRFYDTYRNLSGEGCINSMNNQLLCVYLFYYIKQSIIQFLKSRHNKKSFNKVPFTNELSIKFFINLSQMKNFMFSQKAK